MGPLGLLAQVADRMGPDRPQKIIILGKTTIRVCWASYVWLAGSGMRTGCKLLDGMHILCYNTGYGQERENFKKFE